MVSTIDGGGVVQVMQVASGATLNLKNLIITQGRPSDLFGGGGIFNVETLTSPTASSLATAP
jgi:hypothetical protein